VDSAAEEESVMFTLVSKLIGGLSPKTRLIVEVAMLLVFVSVAVVVVGGVRSCSYNKAKAEYEESRKTYDAEQRQLKTSRDQLIGGIEQRDREIEKLETQKDAYRTMAEQGVRVDQERAKQIEAIATKEAQDLENARKDMDCRARAADTVALLRTAKPPIALDLNAVIRKQCGPAG
jgi:hypothetical protein